MSKTFNRGKLRRLVEAGRVTAVGSYHFDDMYGASRDTAKGMPVAIRPENWKDRKEGVCYLFESDFTSKCGRAWQNDDGTVCLYVHSNSNFDLRINDEPTAKVEKREPTYDELKARIAALEAKLKFAISVPGGFVAGYSDEHLCVQHSDKSHAKQFATRSEAQRFIDEYGDAGFGLTKKSASIVEL